MKRIIIILLCAMPLLITAQNRGRNDHAGNSQDREKERLEMEQREIKRMIEVVGFSTETATKFFAMRKEYFDNISKLWDEKNKTLKDLEKDIKENKKVSEKYLKMQTRKIMEMESNMGRMRFNFLEKVRAMMSTSQYAKFLIFENQWREEVRAARINEQQKK